MNLSQVQPRRYGDSNASRELNINDSHCHRHQPNLQQGIPELYINRYYGSTRNSKVVTDLPSTIPGVNISYDNKEINAHLLQQSTGRKTGDSLRSGDQAAKLANFELLNL